MPLAVLFGYGLGVAAFTRGANSGFGAFLGAANGFMMGVIYADPDFKIFFRRLVAPRRLRVYLTAMFLVFLVSVTDFVIFLHISPLVASVVAVAFVAIATLGIVGLPAFGVYVGGLSERRLTLMGIVFSLVGIATQFLPPVLDLLNIKVV